MSGMTFGIMDGTNKKAAEAGFSSLRSGITRLRAGLRRTVYCLIRVFSSANSREPLLLIRYVPASLVSSLESTTS